MSRSTRLLRSTLIVLGAAISATAVMGALGVLGRGTALGLWLVGLAAATATAWRTRRRRSGVDARQATPLAPGEAALAVALLAALVLPVLTGRFKQAFLYDTLSFHLHFPAAWFASGRLAIVPTVFGDVAPAYNPSNAELVFLLLMAPLRSDYLAQCGQVVFAGVAALAIVATVRELRGTRWAALGSAIAFLLIPEIWQQMPTAMVDLALAAGFLACLPFLIRLGRAPTGPDLLALALAWGIFVGTKFTALALSLPLGACALVALVRHRRALPCPARVCAIAAGSVAIALAGGGFWYLRNLAVTGNPVYPLALRVGGATILPGLYDAAAMRAWDYHVPVSDLGAFGGMLREAGIGFLCATAVALAVVRRSALPAVAVGLLAIFWLVLPYQHSRFLFPAFGVGAVALGIAASRVSVRLGVALVAAAIGGSLVEFPTTERLGLVPVGLIAAFWVWLGPASIRRAAAAVAMTVALAVVATVVATGYAGYRSRFPGHTVGDGDLDAAWAWAWDHVRGRAVAYAGVNLPFPLAGRDLANRVEYVNVAGPAGARVHDFDPGPASSSPTGAEPVPYREGATYEVWTRNLDALRIEWLFVSTLYPIVTRNVAHDADGFPIERAWADAHPERFGLRFHNDGVRIYQLVR